VEEVPSKKKRPEKHTLLVPDIFKEPERIHVVGRTLVCGL